LTILNWVIFNLVIDGAALSQQQLTNLQLTNLRLGNVASELNTVERMNSGGMNMNGIANTATADHER